MVRPLVRLIAMRTVMISGPARGTSRVLRTVGHDGHRGKWGGQSGRCTLYVRRAVEGRKAAIGKTWDFAGHDVPMAGLYRLS